MNFQRINDQLSRPLINATQFGGYFEARCPLTGEQPCQTGPLGRPDQFVVIRPKRHFSDTAKEYVFTYGHGFGPVEYSFRVYVANRGEEKALWIQAYGPPEEAGGASVLTGHLQVYPFFEWLEDSDALVIRDVNNDFAPDLIFYTKKGGVALFLNRDAKNEPRPILVKLDRN